MVTVQGTVLVLIMVNVLVMVKTAVWTPYICGLRNFILISKIWDSLTNRQTVSYIELLRNEKCLG